MIIPSPIYPQVADPLIEDDVAEGFVWATDMEELPTMMYRMQVR